MAGTGVIEIINFPVLSPSNGVVTFSVKITASGGDIANAAFGVSANSGLAPEFWDGLNWVQTTSSLWYGTYGAQTDLIPSGMSFTIAEVKLRFPAVTENTVTLVDFISGYFDQDGNFQKSGTKVTEATTVIPVAPDYTLYYVIGAAGVGVAAVLGYALLKRRK